jgi:Arc/MetJ family transcription regulator
MAAPRAIKTIDVDAGLLAETRNAMKPAAEAGDTEVVERALRSYVGRRALETSQAMSGLSEEAAMRVAYEELYAMRRERRSAA